MKRFAPSQPMTRSIRRGFTLIELMVVISIITLLVAILLPVLSSTRERARTIQCAAQLRSVQFALLNYANDHRSQLPFSEQPRIVPAGDDIHNLRWAGSLALVGHYITPASFWCDSRTVSPALRTWVAGFTTVEQAHSFAWAYTGYSVNHSGAMPPHGSVGAPRVVNVDDPRLSPSTLLSVTEGRETAPSGPGRDGYFSVIPNLAALRLFAHGESVNASFLDGHVETKPAADLGYDPQTDTWLANLATERVNRPWYHLVYTTN